MSYDQPLAVSGSVPVLWATYVAHFILEPLEPDDEARFERAHGEILEWFGGSLKWSLSSVLPATQRFSASDFEMVELRCRQLKRPDRPTPVAMTAAASVDRFSLVAHGGAMSNHASPHGYDFYSEVCGAGTGVNFDTRNALTLTVPATTSHLEFAERVQRIAAILRCRWVSAGYGYGAWPFTQPTATDQAIYAHSRRYWGFDVGVGAGLLEHFHDKLRTINWLTFVSPSLLERAGESEVVGLRHPEVALTVTPSGVWLRAGDVPAACDINRLQVSRAYVAVDAALRKIRASTGVHFAHPWSEKATEDWLRRFERRLS